MLPSNSPKTCKEWTKIPFVILLKLFCTKYKMYKSHLLPKSHLLRIRNKHTLTSWYVVPVSSIDDVVVSEEVFVVAGPPVRVGHHLFIEHICLVRDRCLNNEQSTRS